MPQRLKPLPKSRPTRGINLTPIYLHQFMNEHILLHWMGSLILFWTLLHTVSTCHNVVNFMNLSVDAHANQFLHPTLINTRRYQHPSILSRLLILTLAFCFFQLSLLPPFFTPLPSAKIIFSFLVRFRLWLVFLYFTVSLYTYSFSSTMMTTSKTLVLD